MSSFTSSMWKPLRYLYEDDKADCFFFLVSVMLVGLQVIVIKLHVPNNPVKILSHQNYSALVARSGPFSFLFLYQLCPSTHKRT
jgi:hypothetical protein